MPESGTYTALIADDMEEVRVLMARALEREGFRCDQAKDGLVAENLVRFGRYDIIISDLKMPRKHGHEFLVNLVEKNYPALLFGITGVLDPRIMADLISRGVIDVIPKPVDYPILAARLRAMVDRHRKTRGTAAQATQGGGSFSDRIEEAGAAMRNQLASMRTNFEDTISGLESQLKNLESGFLGSVRVLANLLDGIEHSEGSHAGRVEELAEALAKKAGLNQRQVTDVKLGALLHEIGQFGMPDALRTKAPWALSPDERAAYERYPLIGAALLSEVNGAEGIVEIVEFHTEHFDGTGFPSGRRADAIPFKSRIVRIADGCDTCLMFSRESNRLETIKKHLFQERGKAYDPSLVELAVEHFEEQSATGKEPGVTVIAAENIRPGITLAENLYDEQGRFLVRAGAVVSNGMAPRLRELAGNQRIRVLEQAAPEE